MTPKAREPVERSHADQEAALDPRRCPEHGSASPLNPSQPKDADLSPTPHAASGGASGVTANQDTANPSRSRSDHSPYAEGVAAVFLDRDGVLNDQTAFVNKPEDFNLLPGAAAAVARLNRAGIPVVVVTNQGGIALGYLTEDDLAAIHERMATLLADEGAHTDKIYYCPHFASGTIARYANDCEDRKPGTGMLEKARDDLSLDLRKSVLVGDATTDILAGIRAGCRTILVRTGYAGKDGKAIAEPDHVVADLPAAVDLILTEPCV
ncbi:MAG: HAD family hydrolase [Candidatus Bipolaricaulis sp.]|nr:HAD family hydrolase [Candidatus Bipolaricaulis sp.]